MAIFAQTLKNVDSQINALEKQLQEQKEYREQIQSAEDTAKSSLQSLSQVMRGLKPEDAETVKREVTRWLGLDDMPTTDSTSGGNDNGDRPTSESSDNGASAATKESESTSSDGNGSNDNTDSNGSECNGSKSSESEASGESEAAECNTSNDNGSSEQTTNSEASIFTPVGADSAPKSNGNGKSEQSEAATDSTAASTPESGDNGASANSKDSDTSSDGEDENGVVKHEYFPDEYVQIFDKSHHYNGRVCLIKKLVKTGYYCVLTPRTDEQGSEAEELLLKPHQVIKYQDYELTADSLDDAPKFPSFKENQRVWVKQDGKEFKHQGQIVQLHDDGKAKVKLDGYSNPITIAQKDIKDASKKPNAAQSSG